MIKAAAIAALAIPVLSASATAYTADMQLARKQAEQWQGTFEQVNTDLQELGVDLSAPGSTAEIPETEDTVAVADKGLFFNTANSSLVYLGNVRLRDSRLKLNATEQLHVYLQNIANDKPETPAPTPDTAAKPAKKPQQTKQLHTPEVAEEKAATAAPPPKKAKAETEPTEPAVINAEYAVADSVNNSIFLYSPPAGNEILMQMGQNTVCITPADNAPARILADPQGNILLEGAVVNLCMVDKDGAVSRLRNSGGLVYYHAGTHTLHAPGHAEFSHPDGTLTCTRELCIEMEAGPSQKESGKGFMSQFTGLRFEGIKTATAKGNVVMSGTAAEGREAMRAEGDTLTYNGQTGECSVIGTKCRLTYGNYDVYANDGLHLLANGDIELRGSSIHGTYERESKTPGRMVKGQFKANAHIIFRADTGIITTEKGIVMADEETDFSCTGPAELILARKEGKTDREKKAGMPNLAITGYGEISRARATGCVVAHQYEPGTHKCIGELKAHSVESDVNTGETTLIGEPGMPLVALYNGNRLEATPEANQTATMQMLANGDMKLIGAEITANLVSKDGATTARCKDYVTLIRAEDRLETGSSAEIHTPGAILTTNGPLKAILATSDEAPARQDQQTGGARFKFNYNSIKEATTDSGCTLRTEQGSMQCKGPVRICMEADSRDQDSALGSMKYATAAGDVAIAGKDSTGRLIRATGDMLTIDGATGMKVLSGNRVTVGDAHNTHIITGKGAAIRIDAKNNVQISGSKHKTHATNVREQLNRQNNPKLKK